MYCKVTAMKKIANASQLHHIVCSQTTIHLIPRLVADHFRPHPFAHYFDEPITLPFATP